MTARWSDDDEAVRDILRRAEGDSLDDGEVEDMLAAVRPPKEPIAPPVTHRPPSEEITSAKIVIAGGFGVGKTTLVGAVSEIEPLTTEAVLTSAGVGVDDASRVPGKETTTVAMDFGRITMADDLILYLFGTPGQTRFWFMWDELIRGAIGAVVLVDTRRLTDAFASLDYFENRQLPYLVAVNAFAGAPRYELDEVREALAIAPGVPLIMVDARHRESVKTVLVGLIEHAMATLVAEQGSGQARTTVH